MIINKKKGVKMKKLVISFSVVSILFLSGCEQNVSYDGVESAGKRLGN